MHDIETRTQGALGYVALAGAVGWTGTYAVDEFGLFSLELDIYLVVLGWAVLVAAGALWIWPTPTLRRASVWRLWGAVSAVALAVNAVANTPQLIPSTALFTLLQDYAYYHPWFAAYAVGYLATARYQPRSRLISRPERSVYAAASVLSAAVLVVLFARPVPDEYAILAGGLLNVIPPVVAIGIRRR